MENNEIMTNEVIEEAVEVVEETKKINPATGIVASLAIVGAYYIGSKAVELTKYAVQRFKTYKGSKANNESDEFGDVVEDYFAE